jgi:anti-sigma regulatory factor (Ser/Thr protein kinase)
MIHATCRETENTPNETRQRHTLRTLDEADGIQELVCDLMTKRGFDSCDVVCVGIALDESLKNAIKHGNRFDPWKQVRVDFRINKDHVWLDVEDEGDGFDLTKVPDPTARKNVGRPNGRGILIMQNLMCSVEYNERGNRMTMQKHRST